MGTPRKESTPNLAGTGERFTISYRNPSDMSHMMDDSNLAHKAKKERTKQALLGILPPADKLNAIMNSNSEWWKTWRTKCSGTSSTDETLPQFASRALAEGNMGALGTVVLAVGICSDDESEVERYVEAIDRWVLADDEYAATLEGMELLILKAKWFADVGQPRRAWIAQRKGLMYTQLMVHLSFTSTLYDTNKLGLSPQTHKFSRPRIHLVVSLPRRPLPLSPPRAALRHLRHALRPHHP
jgi:hypothetical protein